MDEYRKGVESDPKMALVGFAEGKFDGRTAGQVNAGVDLMLSVGECAVVVSWVNAPVPKSLLALRQKVLKLSPEALAFAEKVFDEVLQHKL